MGRMRNKNKAGIEKLILIAILMLALASIALSAPIGSESYYSNLTITTSGGGTISSASYNATVSIAQPITGKLNSSIFKNYLGLIYARNFTYVNSPPVIVTEAVTEATQNSTYIYDVNATDADNDVLVYSLLAKPSGMVINSNTGLINWTPANEQVGLNNVTVMVTDNYFNVTQSFTINVSNINDAPLIHSSAYPAASARRPYNYTINATDPDNDSLTYAVNSTKFSQQANFFNWTPTESEIGQHTFNFSVSDGSITVYEIANITVYNFTGPVLVKNIPNQTWNEDTNLTNVFDLDDYFVDATGDNLSYSFVGNQSIAVLINSTTNNASFSQPADWYGVEYIVFTASDGNSTASSNNITLTVINTPDCGDGSCNGNESCSSCAVDCGVCPPITVAGAGVVFVEDFSLDRDLIMTSVKQGSTKREFLKITNTGTATLDFTVDAADLSRFVLISEKKFTLKPLQSKTIALDFFASELEKPDIYTGQISVAGDSKTKKVGVILEVLPKTAIFDIKVKVLDASKYVVKGEEVYANITMFNLGDLKPVDVELYYSVKDLGGNILTFATETLAIYSESSITRKLKLPENAVIGDYVFYAKISYTNLTAASGDLFHVTEIKQTCYDGIQNQNEEGIDCGGICKPCAEIAVPKKKINLLPILLSIIVLIIVSSAGFVSFELYKIAALRKKGIEKENLTALKNYVLDTLTKGYIKPEITVVLEKAGWKKGFIERAFSEVLKEALNEVKERDADRIEEVYIRILEMGYTKGEAGQAINMLFRKE